MYVTAAEFRGSGGNPVIAQATTNAIPDSELNLLIERASRIFDQLCGVESGHFEPTSGTASARTFYGDGTYFLKLDPYVAGSLNATITVPSQYTAPDFIERDGYLQITSSDGIPLSRSYYGSVEGWWMNVPITVSAKWGFSATPQDVKYAVIELSVNLWRETDPANIKLINLEGQPLREKYPPRVKMIADKYRAKSRTFV